MKIDSNLRQAIKACERCQSPPSFESQRRAQKAVIEHVIKLPAHAAKVKAALGALAKAREITEKAEAVFEALGISPELNQIEDEDLFRAAGGHLNARYQRWNFNKIVAEIAAADPAEARKILKRIGINWE